MASKFVVLSLPLRISHLPLFPFFLRFFLPSYHFLRVLRTFASHLVLHLRSCQHPYTSSKGAQQLYGSYHPNYMTSLISDEKTYGKEGAVSQI